MIVNICIFMIKCTFGVWCRFGWSMVIQFGLVNSGTCFNRSWLITLSIMIRMLRKGVEKMRVMILLLDQLFLMVQCLVVCVSYVPRNTAFLCYILLFMYSAVQLGQLLLLYYSAYWIVLSTYYIVYFNPSSIMIASLLLQCW